MWLVVVLLSAVAATTNIYSLVPELAEYQGQVSLIINVASYCGYTESSYTELVRLHSTYQHLGLTVLAFPSNEFGAQEPDSREQITRFALEQYGAVFPVLDKVTVNGPSASPVFRALVEAFPGPIPWNFHGIFLVDRAGRPVYRAPGLDWSAIEREVRRALLLVPDDEL